MPNRILTTKEYKKIYKRLNLLCKMSIFTSMGMVFTKCNGKMVDSFEEMQGYKVREELGEKINYISGHMPYGEYFYIIITSDGNYIVSHKDDLKMYV